MVVFAEFVAIIATYKTNYKIDQYWKKKKQQQ